MGETSSDSEIAAQMPQTKGIVRVEQDARRTACARNQTTHETVLSTQKPSARDVSRQTAACVGESRVVRNITPFRRESCMLPVIGYGLWERVVPSVHQMRSAIPIAVSLLMPMSVSQRQKGYRAYILCIRT